MSKRILKSLFTTAFLSIAKNKAQSSAEIGLSESLPLFALISSLIPNKEHGISMLDNS